MWLFRPKTRRPAAQPVVPEGRLIYAIGDVHGRLDLLSRLTKLILDDSDQFSGGYQPHIILLGDYIDRGPDSFGVVEHVLSLAADPRLIVTPLKGNHEQALLAFLRDSQLGPAWASYGGLSTLSSYLGGSRGMRLDAQGWESTRLELLKTIPPEHMAFFKALKTYAVQGDYCFVHAGLRPGISLESQDEHDLLNIRSDFLLAKAPFEKVVVYGHTPELSPVVEPNRIGIDTGAFATGVLTCLRLVGSSYKFIQVSS